jgi:hypothetical protein
MSREEAAKGTIPKARLEELRQVVAFVRIEFTVLTAN